MATHPYETHPERKVLKLDNQTLLEFIKDQEERNFRTEHDTGANPNALFIWNMVRRLAGLPDLKRTDLPAYCEICEEYHQYPHKRRGARVRQRGDNEPEIYHDVPVKD